MTRRLAALVAVTALIIAGCGSSSAPALTDPRQILAQSITALQGVKTAHLHLDVSGSFSGDVTGSGTPTTIDLSGTSADADVDLTNKDLHLSVSVPALLGVSADVIVIGNDTYTKVSLLGSKYRKSTTTAALGSLAPLASGGTVPANLPTDPTQILADVKAALDKLVTPPVKDADEQCGDQSCYKVSVTITPADLAASGMALGTGVSGTAAVDVWVRKSDLIPAKIVATVNGGSQGSLTATLTFSNVNGSVTIAAPSPDQIDTSGS
ncbi:MAG: LolA-like protein [Candidatus Limnocylindrales bacterium]